MVPIPQEPTGGGGGVVRRRKGGLDGERNTPSSLSSTVGMARKGRGRKQSDKGKEVSGRKLERMQEMMKNWTSLATPSLSSPAAEQPAREGGRIGRWERSSPTSREPRKEAMKKKNPVLSRWKEAEPVEDSYEAWRRTRTEAVKRKEPEADLHNQNSTLESTPWNKLHNKKLCISENNLTKINTNLSCRSNDLLGASGTPGGRGGGQDQVQLRVEGGNVGTADLGAPSARAKNNTTGVSWLKRLGEKSEIKANMRKKTGDTGKKF